MKKKTTSRPKTLPAILVVRMIKQDLHDAICGSPTKCAIANGLRRIIEDDSDLTFLRVNPQCIAITWKGMLHHYELTKHAMRLVAQNDDGTLSFASDASHTLRLPRTWVRPAYQNVSKDRYKQIRAAGKAKRARDKAAGIPPKVYARRMREQAAKGAGVHEKKLQAVQQARATP